MIVAVSETGSLSNAAKQLGISQPAVSSQIKRIQALVGGELFSRGANGSVPTELGKLVLYQGRRMLEANDQILRLGGATDAPQVLRLGLSTLFFRDFIRHHTAETLRGVFIHTDHSLAIAKALADGYVDIACIFESHAIEQDIQRLIIDEFSEPLIWVRAKDFVLSPGAPIPILTWPGDDWMIRTLTRHGLSYQIVFNSPDFYTKLSAVEAGIGLTAIPQRMLPQNLVRAQEYYLPELPKIKALLCHRSGLETDLASKLVMQLTALFFERTPGTDRIPSTMPIS